MPQARPTEAASPDVNATCGPALKAQLSDAVRRKLLSPIHLSWAIKGNQMIIDGIYAQGEESHYLIARCSVIGGVAKVEPLEDRKPE
jgi:hypothetical protein